MLALALIAITLALLACISSAALWCELAARDRRVALLLRALEYDRTGDIQEKQRPQDAPDACEGMPQNSLPPRKDTCA